MNLNMIMSSIKGESQDSILYMKLCEEENKAYAAQIKQKVFLTTTHFVTEKYMMK